MSKLIVGGGGGGGGGGKGGGKQYKPTTAIDGLNSAQYAQIIDLISEGEIEGLKNGLFGIYINNTPLYNPDGTFNFQDLSIYTVNGTQNQAPLPLGTDVQSEIQVNTPVLNGLPIVRSITRSNVDAVRITISVPVLQEISDKGDIFGTDVRLQIAVQYNGGGYTTVIDDTISGRTGDLYQKDYVINFTGARPADIRVTRITPDSSDPKLTNAFSWSSFTEITRSSLSYPNSALVGIRINAEQFSSIPSRSYLVRGIKVKVPNNCTVDQTNGRLIYSGMWNGVFGPAVWTTDPCWILWDLLTARYGFGDQIQAETLDKFSFYSASQYAATLVADGFGGLEPRFSCNVNIQTQEEAFKLINDLCSVFRAQSYWSVGSLTISQDKPADASCLFTLANVAEGGFSYENSSQKTRPTVAVVGYLDLNTREIAYEVTEDADAIAKYGVVTTQVSAFACTSRGQASRIGKWLLYEEQNSEIVSFTTSVDSGVICRPGQIIQISDPMRAGARRGGRISSATTTAITVDDLTGLTATNSPTLSVVLSDGSLQTRNISSIVGNVISVSSAFSSAPNANSIWVFETSDIQTSTWRVLGVAEQDQFQYAVTAIAYNASKYAYIEDGALLQARDTTNLNELPAPPTDLTGNEVLYENNGRAQAKIIVTWRQVPGVNAYRVRWRQQFGNWNEAKVTSKDYEILDNLPAIYEIEVYSIKSDILSSAVAANLRFSAYGKTAPPVNVTGLSLIPIDSASAILSWNSAPDLDVRLGGKVLIRHSVLTAGAVWDEAQELVPSASGNQTQKQVPLLSGTVLVKFEDDTGNRSVSATNVVTTLPTPQPRLVVTTYAEDAESPPFTGNYTNMVYDAGLDGIVLLTGITVDELATDNNWDGLSLIDSYAGGGVLGTGEYEFGSTFDMGATFDVNIMRRFVTRPFLPDSLWDDKLNDIDDWVYIDDANLDKVNASLYVRSTTDNPAGTPTWSAWRPFANAIVKARGFQFKVIAESFDSSQNIIIDQLGAVLELQQRSEQSATLTSPAATYNVTFANAFYQAPSLGLTAFNMATGDYWAITSVTTTGFAVTFRDSAGTAVARQFTYNAVGYGKAS
jgi:hypothetical protein